MTFMLHPRHAGTQPGAGVLQGELAGLAAILWLPIKRNRLMARLRRE